MRMLFAALAALVLALPAVAEEKKALTGENTKITFVGTKPGGKHDGGFKTLTGTATVEGDALTKSRSRSIRNRCTPDDPKLTAHLKSPDFFGVKNEPEGEVRQHEDREGRQGLHDHRRPDAERQDKEHLLPGHGLDRGRHAED